MFRNIKPISIYQWTKRLLLILLVIYSGVSTVLLLKMKPKTLVIGIDSYGTRVIETTDDRLIRMEKHNFVKKFIHTLYNYSEITFSQNVSQAGDMMNRDLWEKRKPEYLQLSEGLKTKPLKQEVLQVEDIRELDISSYQADIKLKVTKNLI